MTTQAGADNKPKSATACGSWAKDIDPDAMSGDGGFWGCCTPPHSGTASGLWHGLGALK